MTKKKYEYLNKLTQYGGGTYFYDGLLIRSLKLIGKLIIFIETGTL